MLTPGQPWAPGCWCARCTVLAFPALLCFAPAVCPALRGPYPSPRFLSSRRGGQPAKPRFPPEGAELLPACPQSPRGCTFRAADVGSPHSTRGVPMRNPRACVSDLFLHLNPVLPEGPWSMLGCPVQPVETQLSGGQGALVLKPLVNHTEVHPDHCGSSVFPVWATVHGPEDGQAASQAGQTRALVKSPNEHGSTEGLSAHKQTPPTCSPWGPPPLPSSSGRVRATGIAWVTRMSLGGQKVGSLIAGVSAWGLDTGTSPFRESSEHSHKWGLKLQSRTRTRLKRLSSSSSSGPVCRRMFV